MSDGMTDESRRDRMLQRKMEKLHKKLGPVPHFGGLITDPIPGRLLALEERMSRLETALLHTGCCCKFDEDGETILEPYLAHALWRKSNEYKLY